MMESIAPPTKSEPGSPIISGNRIPHASSHSIPSFFPPTKSHSGGSASNEIPPQLSLSVSSFFPPTKSHSGGSASNEIPPQSSLSISSFFPPTRSQIESSESNERLPQLSHSIPAIISPTQSDQTESSVSNGRLIAQSSHFISSVIQPDKSDTTSSDSVHQYSPSHSIEDISSRPNTSIYAFDNFKDLRLSSSIDGEKLGSQAIVKSIAPPNTSNPSEPMRTNIKDSTGITAFEMEFGHWLEEQHKQNRDLRNALNAHISDVELRMLVDTGLDHYTKFFRMKASAAKADVFYVMFGMWKTSAERFFSWIGGFRPSELLKVLGPQLEPMTEQQLMGIFNLLLSCQQAEDCLTQGMDKLLQNLADSVAAGQLVEGSYPHMISAMEKLEALEILVNQADHLRKETLQQMYQLLTVRQAAQGLIASGEYFQRLRALSTLWATHPRVFC